MDEIEKTIASDTKVKIIMKTKVFIITPGMYVIAHLIELKLIWHIKQSMQLFDQPLSFSARLSSFLVTGAFICRLSHPSL
jgi:hypothetical protein